MSFKVSVVLGSWFVAVSLAAQQKGDPTNEDRVREKRTRNVVRGVTYPVSLDMLSEVLSFLPPFQWAGLRRVDSNFYACLGTAVRNHFKQYGIPMVPRLKAIVCSEKRKIDQVLKSVMDKPGFRGAIFNGDECTLINHSLRGSQVRSESEFTGRVKITGVADVEECSICYESRCNDYFLHRTESKLHARNIRTGQDIEVDDIGHGRKALMVNENTLVIMDRNELLMYELDWDANTADRVMRELEKAIYPEHSKVLMNDCGNISSVLCRTDNGYYDFDIESNEWKLIQDTSDWRTNFGPDGKVIFRSENGLSIKTLDGKTTFLEIPGDSYFYLSPNGKFVVFEILSEQCIMDLGSGEITVMPGIIYFYDWDWLSDNVLRMKHNDGRVCLRYARKPCVDVVTVNENHSLIQLVKVNDEVDAGDIFHKLDRIGPNLYYSGNHNRVIQVQWIDKHNH